MWSCIKSWDTNRVQTYHSWNYFKNVYICYIMYMRYRGVRWRSGYGTTLQTGRSRVRFPMVSLEFFSDMILRSHYGPGVDSASNRNEYQVYFLGGKGDWCIRLTTLPPSCAVVMKSGNLNFLEPSGPLQACNGTALPLPLHEVQVYQRVKHKICVRWAPYY